MGLKGGNLGREEGWWALKVGTWEGRRGGGPLRWELGTGGGVVGLSDENSGSVEGCLHSKVRTWEVRRGDQP